MHGYGFMRYGVMYSDAPESSEDSQTMSGFLEVLTAEFDAVFAAERDNEESSSRKYSQSSLLLLLHIYGSMIS
jgi:hypothetical protein